MLSGVSYSEGGNAREETIISILIVTVDRTRQVKIISVATVAISHGEAPDSHHY